MAVLVWESIGLQGDPTSPFWRRSALGFLWKEWYDAKAKTPVLWPPHVKGWLIGKDSDAGRDCGQEEKGTTEDEMGGWHHWINGRESEWTPGVGDGQGGLACCDSWGHKESDMTERLNWTELNWDYFWLWKSAFYFKEHFSLSVFFNTFYVWFIFHKFQTYFKYWKLRQKMCRKEQYKKCSFLS